MQELVDSFKEKLVSLGVEIHLGVELKAKPQGLVVYALPAYETANYLQQDDSDLSEALRSLPYLPLSSVTLGLSKLSRYIRGFGCLFPQPAQMRSLGVLFNNDIFENRGPDWTETWIVPLAGVEESELIDKVLEDRSRLFSNSETLKAQHHKVYQWPRALPLYGLQLERVLKMIAKRPEIYLVGNYLGRLGLSKMLDQCAEVAERLIKNER
jgi:oxygen-dependent protoporphyrinogen oxidase